MKFLCLAYGDEKTWDGLSEREQNELLAQDDLLRERGDLVAAVGKGVTTVRAWDGNARTEKAGFASSRLPLAGCCIIEADDIEDAVRLIADTPCARAKGAIEVRPIIQINEFEAHAE